MRLSHLSLTLARKDDRYKLDELEIVNSIMVADNYMMALVNEEKLDFQVPILSCVYRLELVTMVRLPRDCV